MKQAQFSLDKSKSDDLCLNLLGGFVKFCWGCIYFSLAGFSLVWYGLVRFGFVWWFGLVVWFIGMVW